VRGPDGAGPHFCPDLWSLEVSPADDRQVSLKAQKGVIEMAKSLSVGNTPKVVTKHADVSNTVANKKEVPMNKTKKPLGPSTKLVVDSPARLIDHLAPGNPEYSDKNFVAVIYAIYDGDEQHALVAYATNDKAKAIRWLDSALAYGDALLTKGQRRVDTVSEGTVYQLDRSVLKDADFHWTLQDAYYHGPLFRGEEPDMFTFGEPVWGETVTALAAESGKPLYERRAAR
jgi:hypothetical protein